MYIIHTSGTCSGTVTYYTLYPETETEKAETILFISLKITIFILFPFRQPVLKVKNIKLQSQCVIKECENQIQYLLIIMMQSEANEISDLSGELLQQNGLW